MSLNNDLNFEIQKEIFNFINNLIICHVIKRHCVYNKYLINNISTIEIVFCDEMIASDNKNFDIKIILKIISLHLFDENKYECKLSYEFICDSSDLEDIKKNDIITLQYYNDIKSIINNDYIKLLRYIDFVYLHKLANVPIEDNINNENNNNSILGYLSCEYLGIYIWLCSIISLCFFLIYMYFYIFFYLEIYINGYFF